MVCDWWRRKSWEACPESLGPQASPTGRCHRTVPTVKGGDLAVTSLLNEGEDLVRGLGGRWLGILVLSQLFWRYAECRFVAHVFELGDQVGEYGALLHLDSLMIAVALPLALYGRAVYVRAGHAQWSTGALGSAWYPLKVPLASLLNYLAVALTLEVLFLLLGWTVVALLPLAGLAGLAAATSVLSGRPGLRDAWGRIFEAHRFPRPLFGLALVIGLALLVAWLNLLALLEAGVWLVGGPLGIDLAAWRILWSKDNPYFLLWAWAGARILVEPFWLASHVALVNRVRSRSSGDDLRRRFAELTMPTAGL